MPKSSQKKSKERGAFPRSEEINHRARCSTRTHRVNQSRSLISRQSDRSETTDDYEKFAPPLAALKYFMRLPPTCVSRRRAESGGSATTARVFICVRGVLIGTRVHRHEEASALVQRAALISGSGSLAALMTRRVIRIPLQIYRYRSAIFDAFAAIRSEIYDMEKSVILC